MPHTDFFNHCIERHGPSVALDAAREQDMLEKIAGSVVAYVGIVATVHNQLDMAREYTCRDGRVVRLDYDRASAMQMVIDSLELGQEAAREVERLAFAVLKSPAAI